MSRRTGRTLGMVRDLPDDGAIVIVPNDALRRYVEAMIASVRGPEFLQKCRVRAVCSVADAYRCLVGQRRHIAIDHAFEQFADLATIECVLELVRYAQTRAAHQEKNHHA